MPNPFRCTLCGEKNGFEPGFEPIFFAVWRTFCVRGWRGAPHRRGAAPLENFRPHKALGKHICPRRSGPKCSPAKTFFVRNLEISPHSHSNYSNYDLIPTDSIAQHASRSPNVPEQIPERTYPSAPAARRRPVNPGSNPFFSLQGELFARADSAERLTAAERRL